MGAAALPRRRFCRAVPRTEVPVRAYPGRVKPAGVLVLCLVGLGCRRPPPAECEPVADQLASIELGNYAEPEARRPIVAKYKAACHAARVSREEAQCIDQAHDRWSAGQCVPRMFPELASSSTGDCAATVAKTKAMMATQAAYLSGPNTKKWFDLSMQIMQQSCEDDRWPDALKTCVLASDGTPAAMQACNQQMPPALQQALQGRLTKAMQAQQRP